MIWALSLIVQVTHAAPAMRRHGRRGCQAYTSDDDAEIRKCLDMIRQSRCSALLRHSAPQSVR